MTLNDNIRENKGLMSIISVFTLRKYKKEQIELRTRTNKKIKIDPLIIKYHFTFLGWISADILLWKLMVRRSV